MEPTPREAEAYRAGCQFMKTRLNVHKSKPKNKPEGKKKRKQYHASKSVADSGIFHVILKVMT